MQFDPKDLDQKAIYKLLTGVIIPRPIGWVSSLSEAGVANLAPFSFFNALGDDPPHLMFSQSNASGNNRDTLTNVLSTKQFVVNMVTEELTEQMNLSSHPIPSHESEFAHAGVTPARSVYVKPPRVLESPVSMECELVHHFTIPDNKHGGNTIVIGRILMFHFADNIMLDNYRIDLDEYKPVSRLAGAGYARLGEVFSIKRNPQ
jgi:flavin reductase (DIM6/NTAB) family NADH-FMN oxidoreductase RutF